MPEIGNKIAKPDTDAVDETFDISQSGSYHLSIQTKPGRLSFCVFNTIIHKYIVLRNYSFFRTDPCALINECRLVFENDELLRLKYKSSGLLWISPRSTLVPHNLFNPDKADTYLTFNHGATVEQTRYNYIQPVNLCQIFSYPETLTDLFRRYQPDIQLFHHLVPFLQSVNAGSKQFVEMAVFFYSPYLDIMVVEDKKLLFYNTFQIGAPEDSVYYLAGVANLFDMDLLSTNLLYAGNLKCMPREMEILKKHVGRIVECEPPHSVTYSYLITEPFRKNFINLFNLYGCES